MISKRKATYFKILILLNSLKSCTRSTASSRPREEGDK